MKKGRWLPLLLAGLLALGGCRTAAPAAPPLREPAGMTLDTAQVRRGEFYTVAAWEGLVQPQVLELSFPAAGLVAEVNVCVGSRVERGQVLAKLDAGAYSQALQSMREGLDYQRKATALTLKQASLRVEIARAELEQLRAQGGDTRRKEIEIQELENALQADEALWALDERDWETRIQALEAQVEGSILTAPCDGTVVFCAAQEGGYALGHTPLLWLADDAEVRLVTDYISSDAIARASQVYATVARERVEVSYTPMERAVYLAYSAAGWPLKSSFQLTDDRGHSVEHGMAAVVFLVTDYVEDALTIPAGALRRDGDGSHFVYKLVDGVQQRQAVTRGKFNDARVQILQGLAEGEEVYVGN